MNTSQIINNLAEATIKYTQLPGIEHPSNAEFEKNWDETLCEGCSYSRPGSAGIKLPHFYGRQGIVLFTSMLSNLPDNIKVNLYWAVDEISLLCVKDKVSKNLERFGSQDRVTAYPISYLI